jgi:hypothetical protein
MVHFRAACPFFMSFQRVHAASPCCISMLLISSVCFMFYFHAACPCCMSLLHVCAVCPFCMSMKHVRAAYLCCLSALYVSCFNFMLRVHLHVFAACPCCMSVLHVHAARQCCMSVLHICSACPRSMFYCISMLHDVSLGHVLCEMETYKWMRNETENLTRNEAERSEITSVLFCFEAK